MWEYQPTTTRECGRGGRNISGTRGRSFCGSEGEEALGVSRSGSLALGHLKVAATVAKLAAAYELDDFEAIAGGYLSSIPFGFGQDFEVVLDGYAAGVEAEMVQQGTNAGAGRQLLRFAVYVNVDFVRHGFIIPRERGVSHARKSGGSQWPYSLPHG